MTDLCNVEIVYGRLSFSLRRIVGENLSRIRDWPDDKKRILYENVIDYFSRKNIGIPEELRAIENERFKFDLGHDETFWDDLGIPRHKIDKYWDDLRAAIALWYNDMYCMQ